MILCHMSKAAAQNQLTTGEDDAQIKVIDTTQWNSTWAKVQVSTCQPLDFVVVCQVTDNLASNLYHHNNSCPLHSAVVLEVVNDVRGQSPECFFFLLVKRY